MAAGRPFDRWLAGDASAVVLHTESADFTRGLIRRRIFALREAVLDGLSDRAGLVVVLGPNDDRTLCASVAGQLAGRLTTVIDPRSAGEADRVLGSNDVAALLIVGGSRVQEPRGAVVLDVDALVDAADRTVESDRQSGRSELPPADGFAPGTGDCLVLFSSGSTGTPKGIVRSHESMLRAWSMGELRALDADPCTAITGPLGYVSSQLVVHQAWRSGVPIALFDSVNSGLLGLVAFLTRTGVTMLSSQVAPYRSMLELPEFGEVGLRWLSLWGEPLLERDFQRHRTVQPLCHLMFGYGSTEMMVAGCLDVAPGEMPERLARFQSFRDVLLAVEGGQRPDENGSTGELLVHNPWLATAYLGDAEKTAATFVEHEGRRWARTGDRVTLRPDGTFELHGRVDDRLKVLGHNVDPAAVEASLSSLPGIAEAAVVGVDRPGGGTRLAAFVVRTDSARESIPDFRRSARAVLAPASVPSTWTVVESLPRLATGKVDRLLLRRRAADLSHAVDPENRPTNDIERVMLHHVCDLLGIGELGIDDDLLDLGLDSLMLADLQVRVANVLTLPAGLTLTALEPTVRSLSRADVPASVLVSLSSEDTSGSAKGDGDEPHIVLVPGAGSSVLSLRPLARRLPDFARISGINATDFVSVSRLVDTTLQALLDEHVRSPQHRVVFVGHSWGGLIAVELARGAIEAGLAVDGVVLLDSRFPARWRPWRRARRALRPRARWAEYRRRGLRGTNVEGADRNRMTRVAYRQILDASRIRWRPVACFGRVVVAEYSCEVDVARWRRFFPEGFSVSTVIADHNSMIFEPFVADVADAVRSTLAEWSTARLMGPTEATLGPVSSSP